MEDYRITKEQFNDLRYIKDNLRYFLDDLSGLCATEKPDVVYGFELGKLHTYLSLRSVELIDILADIQQNELIDGKTL